MVYDWDDKEEACYRLYVEEGRSLDEVMTFMKEHYGFLPSKRAYQTQFKRWGFPTKHNPAYKNAVLVARIKQLWEQNVGQREMAKTLVEEGFDIRDRELMRVRVRNRWLLRAPNGLKQSVLPGTQDAINPLDTARSTNNDSQIAFSPDGHSGMDAPSFQNSALTADDVEERDRKRKQRRDELAEESAARWATRKRRRRTRGYAGLPADPPGPPRYPSETTLDEAKVFLDLDPAHYKEVREQFQQICAELEIVKKTLAGAEKWLEAKTRLTDSNDHLRQVFAEGTTEVEQKRLSLDVLCTDVTKRMRGSGHRMTIAEAKKLLAINPAQGRQLRNSFYALLRDEHFTSKLEAGESHWSAIKQRWFEGNPLARRLSHDNRGKECKERLEALEALCRDAMKRFRADQIKRHAINKDAADAFTSDFTGDAAADDNANPDAGPDPNSSMLDPLQADAAEAHANLQIDPSLLLAAHDSSAPHQSHPRHNQHHTTTTPSPPSFTRDLSPMAQTAVYFRLHPDSNISQSPSTATLWLGSLSDASLADLHTQARGPHESCRIIHVDGLAHPGRSSELAYRIDAEAELAAFMAAHVRDAKVVFQVRLGPEDE